MKVLFLCTGNSARSQMAEGFFKKYAGPEAEVYSAGLNPGGINPYAIGVMDEAGVDIRDHTSDHVNDVVGTHYFNYIITVCADADANCPSGVYALGSQKLHWPFDDPAAATGTEDEITAVFRRVRDEIDEKVRVWVAELKRTKALSS